MWRWVAVWCATTLSYHIVSGTIGSDWRLLNSKYSGPQLDCFDYPADVPFRFYEPGWGLPRKISKFPTLTPKYLPSPTPFINIASRKFDISLSNREDIVKEHAKLVQDINGLKQVMFVPPIPDEPRDYDDSIFHEIIETSTTTTRPPTTKPTKPSKGFPILLVGGASRKHSVKSQPLKGSNSKHTISLVGTSVTPLVRYMHPYMMTTTNRQPIRICLPLSYTSTTPTPNLWERLLKTIIPR